MEFPIFPLKCPSFEIMTQPKRVSIARCRVHTTNLTMFSYAKYNFSSDILTLISQTSQSNGMLIFVDDDDDDENDD